MGESERPVSIEVKLVGADTCNRYKLMREIVLDEAARANVEIALVEENEATGIPRILRIAR
jgi:hypothetical protein